MLAAHLIIPLATSGTTVVGVVVGGSLVLLAILLRAENKADAEERRKRDGADEHERDA